MYNISYKYWPLRIIKSLKKKIIGNIRKKQKTQKRELKKLKKHHKKKGEINSRLNSWKKQGYKMEAEHEINKIANLKNQIKDWHKQGYKIWWKYLKVYMLYNIYKKGDWIGNSDNGEEKN